MAHLNKESSYYVSSSHYLYTFIFNTKKKKGTQCWLYNLHIEGILIISQIDKAFTATTESQEDHKNND